MTVRTRNRLIAFSIVAAPFVFFFCLLLFWDAEPLPPVPPLPNPNGYDDLVKAGKMVAINTTFYGEMNEEQLQKVVSADAAALVLARAGLSNQCRVPIQFSQTYITNHFENLATLKRMAQAFIAEGRLAELNNRPANAAKSYQDAIRFGGEVSRGGVLTDQLVSMAIETMGTISLQKIADRLDAKSCREAAATLETLYLQKQTWVEVMQQERGWSRRTHPGVHYELVRLMSRKSLDKAYQIFEQRFDQQQSKTSQLIIDLAARAYELDKGHPPANAADLVPDYLKSIPQDPVTSTNMVYSP